MILKKNNNSNNDNNDQEDLHTMTPLIISSQSQMTGDFILSTDVKIDGYVEGNVITTKSVIIGEHGHLKGNLKCNNLKLYGCIEGTSEVVESAYLHSTAIYTGKLNAPHISVFPGSRINADININGEKKHSPKTVSEKKSAQKPIAMIPAEEKSLPPNDLSLTEEVKNSQPAKSFLLNNLK